MRLMLNEGVRARRVLLIGAGDGGRLVLNEINKNKSLKLKAVGFLDDNKRKIGRKILGINVLGSIGELPVLAKKHSVDEAIICIPSASGVLIRKIILLCEEAGIDYRIVPGVYDMLLRESKELPARAVSIYDLLRREPVEADIAPIRKRFSGKSMLVTGGAGSIGSELCRQLARIKPRILAILDKDENGIFELKNELSGSGTRIIPLVVDMRDYGKIERLFARYNFQVVFHAAAHKHVSLMEEDDNIEEAVKNNVLVTRNLLRLCESHDAEEVVLISTDKAVNPTSIMGVTKRICELLFQSMASKKTNFVGVRFGNVLDSNGSVIPIFRKQILAGGPVTVTHPEVKRFFMTIPEAVQLIIQAASLAKGGEIFVLDMGEQVKIIELANDMIRLSGYEPGKDIKIKFTGLKKGEKLYEELFYEREQPRFIYKNNILALKPDRITQRKLNKDIDVLLSEMDPGKIKKKLRAIVPEYKAD
ncbi:polysaccharide biosynthesis protein [Candidatus Woesearchaeota archaeon]|nr:polysaccharide biosynthesis protein [Candidatus Woesearchaeota archaeon]